MSDIAGAAAPTGASRAAKKTLGRLWMRFFHACAILSSRDLTAECAARSALILAPHPDDETLGCGATILRKTAAGNAVHVVFACDGRASHRSERIGPDDLATMRQTEARAACAMLGVDTGRVSFLGFADCELHDHHEAALARLRDLILQVRPDEVFVCSGIDGHPDHRALSRIARALLVEGTIEGDLREYPVWAWDLRSWMDPETARILRPFRAIGRQAMLILRGRVGSVSTAGLLARKRAALECHKSQMGLVASEPAWAKLEDAFLRHFFGRAELHFHVHAERRRAVAPGT